MPAKCTQRSYDHRLLRVVRDTGDATIISLIAEDMVAEDMIAEDRSAAEILASHPDLELEDISEALRLGRKQCGNERSRFPTRLRLLIDNALSPEPSFRRATGASVGRASSRRPRPENL